MSYATQQDLIDRYGETELIQLTDRVAIPPAAIDATVTARALDDAAATVDGYLRGRYALPLAATPPALTRVACDLARFFLWGDRADPTGAIAAAAAEARRWLQQVAAGLVTLDAAAPAAAAASGGARVSVGAAPFSRADLAGAP